MVWVWYDVQNDILEPAKKLSFTFQPHYVTAKCETSVIRTIRMDRARHRELMQGRCINISKLDEKNAKGDN